MIVYVRCLIALAREKLCTFQNVSNSVMQMSWARAIVSHFEKDLRSSRVSLTALRRCCHFTPTVRALSTVFCTGTRTSTTHELFFFQSCSFGGQGSFIQNGIGQDFHAIMRYVYRKILAPHSNFVSSKTRSHEI